MTTHLLPLEDRLHYLQILPTDSYDLQGAPILRECLRTSPLETLRILKSLEVSKWKKKDLIYETIRENLRGDRKDEEIYLIGAQVFLRQ